MFVRQWDVGDIHSISRPSVGFTAECLFCTLRRLNVFTTALVQLIIIDDRRGNRDGSQEMLEVAQPRWWQNLPGLFLFLAFHLLPRWNAFRGRAREPLRSHPANCHGKMVGSTVRGLSPLQPSGSILPRMAQRRVSGKQALLSLSVPSFAELCPAPSSRQMGTEVRDPALGKEGRRAGHGLPSSLLC